MISKKLLLMTFAVLVCAATSAQGLNQESPKSAPSAARYAQRAFVEEAAGKGGSRRRIKELFIRHSRPFFGDALRTIEVRQEVLRGLGDQFDAACKKIEDDNYEKTRARHLAACPAENSVRPALKLRKTIKHRARLLS